MSSLVQQPLAIFGASGHAKVVIDVARRVGFMPVAILDDDAARWGGAVAGVPVIGGRSALAALKTEGVRHALVAVGANRIRQDLANWLSAEGMIFPSVIHPAAIVDASAQIGSGCVVMAGAVINADARIGDHVIINTCASVDHDCQLAMAVHVAPGAHICGGVSIGERTLVGVGASIIPGCRIGADAVIGAGAAVISDVAPGRTMVGVPARVLNED